MEKQKDLALAITNQRDMYRTLLAQATPLPPDTSMSFSEGRRQSSGRVRVGASESESLDFGEAAEKDSAAASEEAKKALEETKEQFEAYRKEKMKNDAILQEQMDKLREECSEVKIERARLASKVFA